ncbi:MAG: 3-deoxy-7-phosphoheptulonate synthase [Gammaproteobacteria bacterium]|nr:3-deoxy-7-phosphoheptulonate synthase [Gammaproteobacteria bacterium]NIR82493.1 3-deoxy-7-phosphoheptulonate synthase [Gammaproteobacteria bacterium]NIR88489.1 3-deoxy-7-phosphoheptulonate synthase [Gammaproteobacteria bacterium]NIU03629.1 3-deoxy-7-phosphoheptulonate synthase [Gammaproteobacteria bacterium]NIV50981.1 3-deoxy-7-phosphoheptulonate synthase [Gammaproteobacteria bacterium]
MILILHPNIDKSSQEYRELMDYLSALRGIRARAHDVEGAQQRLTEIYLLGDTSALQVEEMSLLPGVERVVRVSEEYRILGRHKDDRRSTGFEYNGVRFGQDTLHIFAGLCAVDTPANAEAVMRALTGSGLSCTRMGAYKPRTSPYSFQGHGKACLPYVFELAGKHRIKVVAMEVTHESHVDDIREALEATGHPTGVMLQVGTRNTQNFELLKKVGRQQDFPVLLKRGFGITLEESLNAAEYLASEGNQRVIFALRGMKTNMGDPHRNFVDFAHVPVVKRLTRMPVCIDPSHSVGTRERAPDGLMDIFHATAQGVIAGANMILVDFHPDPAKALVDGPQALLLSELPHFVEDVRIAREAYEKRAAAAKSYATEVA